MKFCRNPAPPLNALVHSPSVTDLECYRSCVRCSFSVYSRLNSVRLLEVPCFILIHSHSTCILLTLSLMRQLNAFGDCSHQQSGSNFIHFSFTRKSYSETSVFSPACLTKKQSLCGS
ncbi:hypothetical protein CDAR_537351 [Caerostris darwini]|uniref:Uncharacterized protein n=1 Tax=Caerostris darwini TaxID=1538125 RepID=A0AAV4MYX6_9ARAC|nr:hypothetical protein CDAR_537351 [Caerostris darwini]